MHRPHPGARRPGSARQLNVRSDALQGAYGTNPDAAEAPRRPTAACREDGQPDVLSGIAANAASVSKSRDLVAKDMTAATRTTHDIERLPENSI